MSWKLIIMLAAAIGACYLPAFANQPLHVRMTVFAVFIAVILVASAVLKRSRRSDRQGNGQRRPRDARSTWQRAGRNADW